MSQHDLDLANQAGAAFRADLNNALQALASQNAGTAAPGTTYAHMWWMDTANGILKQRNAANDAWVSVAKVVNGRWYPVEGEYLASSPYCTDTGAADAYVLATDHAGSAPTAYRNGDQYRFRAGASNTGASTVNINGLGAKTLVTVTGVALPAGYIRTDVDTTITYDAANDRFVADREIERGGGAGGSYVRFADGGLECVNAAFSLDSLSGSGSALVGNWVYAAGFSTTTQMSAIAIPYGDAPTTIMAGSANVGNRQTGLMGAASPGKNSTDFVMWVISGESATFQAGDTVECMAIAKGRWY